MNDQAKTNAELIKEISALKQKIRELEQSESERKRASEALRESGEYFKAIIQNSSDIVLILDKLGTITYASPSVECFLGYEPEELIGKRTLDLIVPEDKPRAIADFGRALLTKETPIPNVFRIRHKDGTERILEGIGNNLLDNPIVTGFVMNARDITDRKRDEEALQENEKRLSSIIQGFSIPAFVIGKDHKVLYWNQALERLSNIPAAEVVGTNQHWRAFYSEERPCMADLLVDEVIDKIPQWYERKYIKSLLIDGAYEATDFFPTLGEKGRWLRFTTAAVRDSHGNIVGAVETLEDITERVRAEERLRESEGKYRTLIETTRDLVYTADRKGFLTYMNPTLERTLGYTHDEWNGKNFGQIVAPECIDSVRDIFKRAIRGESIPVYEVNLTRKDGSRFSVEFNVSTIYDNEGKPAGRYGIGRDITERKRAEAALQESEDRYRTLVHNASDIVFRLDDTGYLTFVNPAAIRVTGYEENELIGKHYTTLIRPDRRDEAMKFFGRQFVKKIETSYSEYPVVVKNDREIWLGQNTQLIFQDGKVVAFQAMARDITEMKLAEEKIQQMAYHDSLTGLPNRKLFSDRLGIALVQAQRNQRSVAISMLDLDNFKVVNDTLGHDVGDLLLKAAAERLSAALRKGDTVARFGGDEFVLILPDLKEIEDVIQVAQKIVESFRKPFLIGTHQLIVTASIGIAVNPNDGADETILLKNADIAMYQVKQTGRDRYQLCKKA